MQTAKKNAARKNAMLTVKRNVALRNSACIDSGPRQRGPFQFKPKHIHIHVRSRGRMRIKIVTDESVVEDGL